MATDAVECCWLTRRLALRLTDGLAAGLISTNENAGESRLRTSTTLAVGDGAGENGHLYTRYVPCTAPSHPMTCLRIRSRRPL